ncbi:MAG: NeuD/PglB/VioB family sugar acetyltransferase [Thermoleophilia bacterium]
MNDLVIIGAGGLAKEIAVLIDDVNAALAKPLWRLLGYVDADERRTGQIHGRARILGDDSYLLHHQGPLAAVFAIGSPQKLAAASERLAAAQLTYPFLVHPTAVVDTASVRLAGGVVVAAGSVLTTDIEVGERTAINLNCTVGHDARIGADCVIMPSVNISGGVTLGDRCLIGAGAIILQNLTVGADAIVGAGAVVVHDVPAGTTVVGMPARAMPRHDD